MLNATALSPLELRGPHTDNEPRELDRRLRAYAQHRASLDAAEAFDLVRAQQLKIHLFFGCATLWEYLERLAGYGPHAARERVRVARALASLPGTSQRLASGALNYSAVRELTRVATADTEDEWLAKTKGMTAHQIEQVVSGHAHGDRPSDPKQPDLRPRPIRLELSTEIFALWRQARVALEQERGTELGDLDFIATMCRRVLDPSSGADRPAHQIAYKQCPDCERATQNGAGLELDIAPEVIERAQCDARIIGSLDAPSPERATATVTPRVREQVFARDGHRCSVPGCRSRRNLEVHHIHSQAYGGTHELSNLTILCSGHHAALHAGRLEMTGLAPYSIRFRWRYFEPLPAGLTDHERTVWIDERRSKRVPRGRSETPE